MIYHTAYHSKHPKLSLAVEKSSVIQRFLVRMRYYEGLDILRMKSIDVNKSFTSLLHPLSLTVSNSNTVNEYSRAQISYEHVHWNYLQHTINVFTVLASQYPSPSCYFLAVVKINDLFVVYLGLPWYIYSCISFIRFIFNHVMKK